MFINAARLTEETQVKLAGELEATASERRLNCAVGHAVAATGKVAMAPALLLIECPIASGLVCCCCPHYGARPA